MATRRFGRASVVAVAVAVVRVVARRLATTTAAFRVAVERASARPASPSRRFGRNIPPPVVVVVVVVVARVVVARRGRADARVAGFDRVIARVANLASIVAGVGARPARPALPRAMDAPTSALAIDRAAVDRIARAATLSTLAGALAGAALALRRRRPQAVAPTHAVAGAANVGACGAAHATTLEALDRRPDARGATTHAVAGACVGAGAAWARWGRRAATAGAACGAAAAGGARACAIALEGAGEHGYEFPRWFPVQIVREEGREDELLARMGRAQRGELSAEDEARTRDAYARWKMRRAGRG